MSVVRVCDVSVRYGRGVVLSDVSLPTLEPGAVLGLVGPNGSGKSTLLRAIAGEVPSTGRFEFGTPVPATATRSGRDVFYLPQILPQPTSLLAYELLTAHAEAGGRLSARADIEKCVGQAFDALGIVDLAMRPMHELSGGKRQLVGFAIAIVHSPRLLLLDEPTSALDLAWQIGLLKAVRTYVSNRAAVAIVALHDLGLAARHCDQLALLSNGRLVASGLPEHVLTEETIRTVYGVEARLERRPSGHISIEVIS